MNEGSTVCQIHPNVFTEWDGYVFVCSACVLSGRNQQTHTDSEIFRLAMDHINASLRAGSNGVKREWVRVVPQGYDADGILDLEFPSVFVALDWATAHSARAIVDFRDAVTHPTDSVVLTVNLGDYARKFRLY